VARSSRYKERLLMEKFKRKIDERIRKRLMKIEYPSKSINQLYKRVVRLERNMGESRREEKEKRSKI